MLLSYKIGSHRDVSKNGLLALILVSLLGVLGSLDGLDHIRDIADHAIQFRMNKVRFQINVFSEIVAVDGINVRLLVDITELVGSDNHGSVVVELQCV